MFSPQMPNYLQAKELNNYSSPLNIEKYSLKELFVAGKAGRRVTFEPVAFI